MRIGICTAVERLNDAHEAGFDFAELGAYDLLPDEYESAFASVRDAILASQIPVEAFNCFLPAQCRVVGADIDIVATARRMDVVLWRASQVGAKVVVFGSGGARMVPDGYAVDTAWKELETAARTAAETASKYDITIAMEPLFLGACNLLNRVDEGIAFVDKVSHPNCKLLADLFHMTNESESFDSILAAGNRLAHIHLATPPITNSNTESAYDFPGFIHALKAAGYAGRISVEDNNHLLKDLQPPLTSAYRTIREYVERLLEE